MIVEINRGEDTDIEFEITDAQNTLSGRRVTASIAEAAGGDRVLHKVGPFPPTTTNADITIAAQVPGQINGFIHINPADFALLPKRNYAITLWVDDGMGNDRCVTVGGVDNLTIINDVARV